MLLMRFLFRFIFLLSVGIPFTVRAQEHSDSLATSRKALKFPSSGASGGFQVLPKLGLGMSRNFLVDVGLLGYSYIPDKTKAAYYDANISVMTYIGKHTMVMPKLDLQAGLFPLDHDDLICFNLGVDAGLLTDFKQSAVMITPKAGFSVASGLLRLYYLHNFLLKDKDIFPGYGRHGVLLEVNISVLQGKGLKIM